MAATFSLWPSQAVALCDPYRFSISVARVARLLWNNFGHGVMPALVTIFSKVVRRLASASRVFVTTYSAPSGAASKARLKTVSSSGNSGTMRISVLWARTTNRSRSHSTSSHRRASTSDGQRRPPQRLRAKMQRQSCDGQASSTAAASSGVTK
ncbi:MAG: hypothetical protein AAFV43_11745 [Planctomycetota bacterium]